MEISNQCWKIELIGIVIDYYFKIFLQLNFKIKLLCIYKIAFKFGVGKKAACVQ
jgi:hypothetical protein